MSLLDRHRSLAVEVCWHAQLSSTVSNGLGFASYETGLSMYRKMYEGTSPGPAERGVIAGGAAVTVMAAIQPLEVCCRRMQASTKPSQASPRRANEHQSHQPHATVACDRPAWDTCVSVVLCVGARERGLPCKVRQRVPVRLYGGKGGGRRFILAWLHVFLHEGAL